MFSCRKHAYRQLAFAARLGRVVRCGQTTTRAALEPKAIVPEIPNTFVGGDGEAMRLQRPFRVGETVAAVALKKATKVSKNSKKGFTLVELLVVISIIVVLAAASVPVLRAFSKGQKLEQSARILISTLSDARRLAVTKRARTAVVFFSYRVADDAMDPVRHGVAVYQEPYGAVGTDRYYPGGYAASRMQVFPAGVRFGGNQMQVKVWELGDGVQPSEPLPVNHAYFAKGNPEVVAFGRDGNLEERADYPAVSPQVARNIYMPDEGCYQVPEDCRADIVLVQSGSTGAEIISGGKKRRAFVDLVSLTGRAVHRVFDVGDGFEFTGTGAY